MEELQPEHLRVLKALSQPPKPVNGIMGSPISTLKGRLPDFSENQIEERIQQLNDLRVTNMTSLKTMMTPQGAENLTHAVTAIRLSIRSVFGRLIIPTPARAT